VILKEKFVLNFSLKQLLRTDSIVTANRLLLAASVTVLVLFAFAWLCLPQHYLPNLPSVFRARTNTARKSSMNNFRNIGLAIKLYEKTYGCLPPAYTVDKAGNRLHSWRVLILPQLDEASLYEQIDLSKPWDDPVNEAARSCMPRCYQSPTNEKLNETTYFALVGPECVFEDHNPTRLNQIADGVSNTIMLVEISKRKHVNWMEPVDVTPIEFIQIFKSIEGATEFKDPNVALNVALNVDGTFQEIDKVMSPLSLMRMTTKDAND
jgi:hypothetical protein